MKQPLHILLIDDNPDDRLLTIRELHREFSDLQVTQITEQKSLVQAASEGSFDLVITDYRLNWTNGLAVLHIIKTHRPDCPVIMFTATGSEEIAVEAMKTGLDDYVLKSPKHFARLPSAVHLALERARHRRALQEAEIRYQGLFEGVPVGLYQSTPEGQFINANPALVQMLGYPDLETLLTANAASLYVNPEDRIRWQHLMAREGVVLNFEAKLLRYDSTAIWTRDSARSVCHSGGQILYYEGSLEDITERKLAEAALAEEKERLAVTLRAIGDGVVATDTEGKIVLMNKVAESLTGWTQREAIGQELTAVFQVIGEKTRTPLPNPIAQVFESRKVVRPAENALLVARDGTERIVSEHSAPIFDRTGQIIGAVLVFQDITERRALEEELFKAAKLESLGVLAGGIAHDFNNILTAIIGNISVAKQLAKKEEPLLDMLEDAEKASLKAKGLTQQLLSFSKEGAPVRKTTSISEIIKDSVSFTLRGSKTKCEYLLPDDLWPVEVDEGQISRVIHNLVINADQAMPTGGVIQVQVQNTMVTSAQELPLASGKYVLISIRDQGVGIPREHLARIFDPFFTTKQVGTGLGLATAHSIILKHDGHIWVESEPDVGTAFHIYLPASEKQPQPRKMPEERLLIAKGRILVMDDDSIVRDITARMLHHLGYTYELVKDGIEAISLYRSAQKSGAPFDAVILDLTIPGGIGAKETIKRLLQIDPCVRAIISSGYSNDPVMSNYRDHGFSGAIAKPYKLEGLSEVLLKVIQEERGNEGM